MPILPPNELTESWRPLPSRPEDDSSHAYLSHAQVKQWSLLLTAVQIDFKKEKTWLGNKLMVSSRDYAQALEQIRIYEKENLHWPPETSEPLPSRGSALITLSVIFLVASFHNLTQTAGYIPEFKALHWFEVGTLYAGKFRAGELWRAITALTLHGDLMHIAGNGVVTFLFIEQLRKRYGSGLSWLLFLLSGVSGNTINALLQPYHHQAVGASTAVFGLLGVLAADSFIRYRIQLMRRWAMPLAAACALLGFLGTSGENTDLGAHLWGFFCGVLIGGLVSIHWRHLLPPADKLNRTLAVLSILIVCTAWLIAFGVTQS